MQSALMKVDTFFLKPAVLKLPPPPRRILNREFPEGKFPFFLKFLEQEQALICIFHDKIVKQNVGALCCIYCALKDKELSTLPLST